VCLQLFNNNVFPPSTAPFNLSFVNFELLIKTSMIYDANNFVTFRDALMGRVSKIKKTFEVLKRVLALK